MARLGRRRGLTLIEVLVCVVVIASVSLFLLPSLMIASRIVKAGEGRSQVFVEAVNQLAHWRLLALTVENPKDFPESNRARFVVDDQTATVQMEALPFEEDPALRFVTLAFAWPSARGEERYVLKTVVRLPEGKP